jgi:hypothetical protein
VSNLAKPATTTGVATAVKSGGFVDVNVDGVLRSVQIARDLVVAVGDVVVVHKFGSLWAASARLGTASLSEVPPTYSDLDPNPSTVTGTLVVAPVDTGTYQAGAGWSGVDDVQQGAHGGYGLATGVAFYGSKPQSLAGATVTSAYLERIHRLSPPAASTSSTMWLITEATRPAGAPTRTSSAAGPATAQNVSSTFTVPTAWAQALVDGTAGGIGFYDADGSPWVKFAGRSALTPALTLIIAWSR